MRVAIMMWVGLLGLVGCAQEEDDYAASIQSAIFCSAEDDDAACRTCCEQDHNDCLGELELYCGDYHPREGECESWHDPCDADYQACMDEHRQECDNAYLACGRDCFFISPAI